MAQHAAIKYLSAWNSRLILIIVRFSMIQWSCFFSVRLRASSSSSIKEDERLLFFFGCASACAASVISGASSYSHEKMRQLFSSWSMSLFNGTMVLLREGGACKRIAGQILGRRGTTAGPDICAIE